MLPVRREEQLLVREMAGETLVYDLKSKKAHCLNRPASLVWRYCDGQCTAADIARQVGNDLEVTVDEAVVWAALKKLQTARLLRDPIHAAQLRKLTSRRELIRNVVVAACVPVVMTVVAPMAAAQGTGFVCNSSTVGRCCQPPFPRRRCVAVGGLSHACNGQPC